MAITLQERTAIEKLVVALFNAAPGAVYLQDLTNAYEQNGRSLRQLAVTLSEGGSYKSINPIFQTASEFATAFLTPYQLQGNAEAVAYITAKFNAGQTKGQIAYDAALAIDSYTGGDPSIVKAKAIQENKAAVAEYFSVTKGNTQQNLGTLQQVIATVVDTAASVTAAKTAIDTGTGTSSGNSFTLTTAIDTLLGTALDDTFVADNASLSAADSINGGGGNDTFKIFGFTGSNGSPTLTSVEKLYYNANADSTAAANASAVNISTNSGITGVEFDSAVFNTFVTVAAAQSVTITKAAQTNTTKIASGTSVAQALTLNGTVTGVVQTVDLTGTAAATLNVTAAAASSATLLNAGLALKTINVDGAFSAALTSGSAALTTAVTTVNASANTAAAAGVTYVADGGAAYVTAAGFKFTGGAGNDTLRLAVGNITALTAGTQLDGGAGTGDKLGTFDTAFSAADYTKLNAATGWEVLGMNAAITVDASQLTSIKQFSLDTNAVQVITAMATGSKVTVSAAHAADITLGSAVGVNDVSFTIGGATSAGLTLGGNVTIGHTAVALVSNGTNAAANVITALKNADNSVYTITGSNALTLTTTQATTTGSKYDGSAATGKLTINGNTTAFAAASALGDVIIGGTAGDVIKASVNNSVLTGGAGADTFDVSVAKGGVSSITTITDFTKGDKITFAAATTFTAAKIDLSGAASVAAALDLLAAGTTANTSTWGTFGGNTYLINDTDAGTTFDAADFAVKLNGVLDLSTSTGTGTATITFA